MFFNGLSTDKGAYLETTLHWEEEEEEGAGKGSELCTSSTYFVLPSSRVLSNFHSRR